MTTAEAPAAPSVDEATSGDWTRLSRVRTRPNRRALLFAFLGLLLYGAGANVGAGWVIVVASLMLGALPFAWVTARRTGADVRVRRVGPGTATTDAPTPLELQVRAATPAAAVVRDELSATIGVARGLRQGATLRTEAWLPRGVVTGGDVEIVVGDIFGLVDVTARGHVPGHVEVLPAVPEVAAARPRTAWAHEAGQRAVRQGGGAEVVGIRDYQHGDPARSVHWRSSARHDQLVVREYAEESRPRVLVELAGGLWERAALDLAAQAAAGIAHDARRNGFPTDLGADGELSAWGHATRRRLALLPPHAGAEPRPLAAPPHASAQVVVRFEPGTQGPRIVVRSGGGTVELGALPVDTPTDAIGTWLSQHLDGLR